MLPQELTRMKVERVVIAIYSGVMTIGSEWNESTQRAYVYIYSGNTVKGSDCNEVTCEMLWLYVLVILSKDLTGLR